MSGVYLHIPFCASFCTYCSFYSVQGVNKMEEFKSALLLEIEQEKNYFEGVSPDTLYIGGGTPSFIPLKILDEIVGKLFQTFFPSSPPIEFTIEVNPDDITREYLLALKKLGVNRISMGVQSFDDENLRWMNRRHTSKEAVEAFRMMRESGFDNISLDLIFGYTPLTDDAWRKDISIIIELHPEHISAYQMGLEPGSQLAEDESYTEADETLSAEQFSTLRSSLQEAGYLQYEVSNYSLPGRIALHNSSYWRREPYLGLGPAAHSFKGDCRRWNLPDLDSYCAYFKGENVQIRGSETLSEKEILEEVLMLGLRTIEGVSLEAVLELSGKERGVVIKKLRSLEGEGFIQIDGGRIKIPPKQLFISDFIIVKIFDSLSL